MASQQALSIMLLYRWLIGFRNALAKRKTWSTNIWIHECSFDAAHLPWTSIYQQLTNTSQNTRRRCQEVFYAFLGELFLTQLYGHLDNLYAGKVPEDLQTHYWFRLRNLQITSFVWCKRVIRHLETSNNVVIRVDLYVSLHILYNAEYLILIHFSKYVLIYFKGALSRGFCCFRSFLY